MASIFGAGRSKQPRLINRMIQVLLIETWIIAGCYAVVFVFWAILLILGREIEGSQLFRETFFAFVYVYIAVQLGRVWYWTAKQKRRREEADYYPSRRRSQHAREGGESEHPNLST